MFLKNHPEYSKKNPETTKHQKVQTNTDAKPDMLHQLNFVFMKFQINMTRAKYNQKL